MVGSVDVVGAEYGHFWMIPGGMLWGPAEWVGDWVAGSRDMRVMAAGAHKGS